MTDLYAVMGNPINHSKSPDIHTQFAKQAGIELLYTAMLVPKDNFNGAVTDFFNGSGKGLNITVPFKENAYSFADSLTDRAKTAQAVNTLKLQEDGSILGDNTDGAGLVRDLTVNNQVVLKGKRILIIGSGGAVRGVLQPILGESPAEVVICNRTHSKAQDLVAQFSSMGNINASEFDDIEGSFDVIVNGTSASLNGERPPIPESVIASNSSVYDMMYSKEPTAFLVWAKKLGAAKIIDGLGMLVEQAAVSFHLWRGVFPESTSVLAELKQQLK
jgi:shikimate dehydrogenase